MLRKHLHIGNVNVDGALIDEKNLYNMGILLRCTRVM